MRERQIFMRKETYWLRTTINRKQYRESLRTSDYDVARSRAEKRIAEIKSATQFGIQTVSWKAAVADWASYTVGQLGDSTMRRYAVSLALVTPYFAQYKIHEITGQVINGFVGARRKLGAKPATIRRDLTAISAVLKYAEAMEWREGNPTLSKRALLIERRDPIMLPKHDEIEKVIEAAGPRFGGFIRAAWLTGCRQNELATALWEDYDRANKTLSVIGKGNKRRVIKLSEKADALIRMTPKTLNSDYIFCNSLGAPFLNASSEFVRHRNKVSGVKFRYHDLRHLFAVETLQSGAMGIYELSLYLGHTSVKTTEIYLAFLTTEEVMESKSVQRRVSYGR